jgi:hypothetical protein
MPQHLFVTPDASANPLKSSPEQMTPRRLTRRARSQKAYVRIGLALLLGAGPLAVAAQSAPGTAGAAPAAASPAANVHTYRPTVYVFALSFDNPTQYAISLEAASYLKTFVSKNAYQPLRSGFYSRFAPELCIPSPANSPPNCKPQISNNHVWLIPEPGWALANFINQCQSDPENTAGALIFGAVENDTGSFNYFVAVAGYTQLTADASFITCEPRASDEFLSLVPPQHMLVGTQTQTITGNSQTKSYSLSYAIQTSPVPSTKNKDYVVPKKAKIVSITTGTTQGKSSQAPTQSSILAPLPTPTPAMNMIWDAQTSLHSNAQQLGFPLYLLVAVASYVAASHTTTTTTCTNPSGAAVSQCKSNNSALATGIAVGAGIFSNSSLAAVTVGGSNPTRQLKNAARDLSVQAAVGLRGSCKAADSKDVALKWLCSSVFSESALSDERLLK